MKFSMCFSSLMLAMSLIVGTANASQELAYGEGLYVDISSMKKYTVYDTKTTAIILPVAYEPLYDYNRDEFSVMAPESPEAPIDENTIFVDYTFSADKVQVKEFSANVFLNPGTKSKR